MASTPSIPTTQTALVGAAGETVTLSSQVPVPNVGPDMVLVKTCAVALNPVDAKVCFSKFSSPGCISGCDFAGTIVAIGRHVDAVKALKIGDRVCGVAQGMNPNDPQAGAFAEYVSVEATFVLKLPNSMSFEDGATLGTAVGTCGMALFWSLQLPNTPTAPLLEKPERGGFVLVNGGSSATGTMCIQLIKQSGFRPIATCSKANFDLVRSFGAEQVFDYRSATCADDIKAYTGNSLRYAVDCITTTETITLCYQAIGRAGGRYTSFDPFPIHVTTTRRAVKPNWVLGPAMLGRETGWPAPYNWTPDPALRTWAEIWMPSVQILLDQDKLKCHPTQLGSRGLHGIEEGLKVLLNKGISGKKLVYSL